MQHSEVLQLNLGRLNPVLFHPPLSLCQDRRLLAIGTILGN